MAEKFSKSMTDAKPQIQEGHRTSSSIHTKHGHLGILQPTENRESVDFNNAGTGGGRGRE